MCNYSKVTIIAPVCDLVFKMVLLLFNPKVAPPPPPELLRSAGLGQARFSPVARVTYAAERCLLSGQRATPCHKTSKGEEF